MSASNVAAPGSATSGGGLRRLELARGAWGLACLLAPRAVLHVTRSAHPDTKARRVTRLLGARQLLQAGLSGPSPSPAILALGTWVDAVHALTATGLAALDRPRHRAALTDAAIASTWAVFGRRDLTRLRTSITPGQTPPVRAAGWTDRAARALQHLLPGVPTTTTATSTPRPLGALP